MGCHLEKFDFRSNNIANTFLSFAVGVDLRVCPKDSGKQCCSQRMEDRFAVLASGDFDKAVSSKVGEVRALFNEQAKTFDGELILDKMYKVLKECGLSLPVKNLLMDFHLECAKWPRSLFLVHFIENPARVLSQFLLDCKPVDREVFASKGIFRRSFS